MCIRDSDYDRVERVMTVVADSFAFLVLLNPLQAKGFAQAVRQRPWTREDAARPLALAVLSNPRIKLFQRFGEETACPARVVEIARAKFIRRLLGVAQLVISLLEPVYP